MKEYVNEHTFRDRFMRSDTYKNQFSYEGLHALFEYFEELELEMDGIEIEFDMVAICCEYTEYDSIKDFNADYSNYEDGYTLDDIREETVVIEIPDTERFIIGEF
jgi:hypothetical protein